MSSDNCLQMKINEITESLDALDNPYPIKKIGSQMWTVIGDKEQSWTVVAGAIDVTEFGRSFRILSSSFENNSVPGFAVTGDTDRLSTIRLYGSIIEIIRQFSNVDLIVFKPEDDVSTNRGVQKTNQKGRIYTVIGRYCMTKKIALNSSKIMIPGIGEVVYVIPFGSKVSRIDETQLKILISSAWIEKQEPDVDIIDSGESEEKLNTGSIKDK